MSEGRPLRLAVVGGGVAGMAAALSLADRGYAVTLFERRPFLGGRVYSFRDEASGRPLDNGQHAMLGCYQETLAFLQRIDAQDLLYWHGLRLEMREAGERGDLDAGSTPAPFHLVRALLGYRLLSARERLGAMVGAARLLLRWKRTPQWFDERTVREALVAFGQGEAVCRRLWDPIAIAALNADPSEACASLFAAVVERAFFGRARDASIVLPAAPLEDVFGGPGRRALVGAGVDVRARTTVVAVDLDEQGRVAAIRTRNGDEFRCDGVILSTPPRALRAMSLGGRPAAAVLGPWLENLVEAAPIVSVHVPVAGPVDLPAMVGLLGTTTQWVFHSDRVLRVVAGNDGETMLSCVVSGAADLDGVEDREIARRTVADLRDLMAELGPIDVERVRVVRERNATIAATISATASRPDPVTAVPGLHLAGDWVRTGLPATIEGAALSARLAVEAILRHPRAAGAPAAAERAA